MPIQSLPAELLAEIAGHLTDWGHRQVTTFRLVCHNWDAAGCGTIYREVFVSDGRKQCSRLAATLASRPDLGDLIRYLCLGVKHNARKAERSLKTILAASPNVENIFVCWSDNDLVLSALAESRLPSLRRLSISPQELETPTEVEWLAQTLDHLPSLHSFQLGGYLPLDPPLDEENKALAHLKTAAQRHDFFRLTLGRLCPPSFLDIFTSHCHSTLQELEIDITRPSAAPLLAEFSGLRKLTLCKGWNRYADAEVPDRDVPSAEAKVYLEHCQRLPALRELELQLGMITTQYDHHVEPQDWPSPEFVAPQSYLDNVPLAITSLEMAAHLILGEDLLAFLKSPNRSSTLHHIDFDVVTTLAQISIVHEICTLCRQANISYRMSHWLVSTVVDEDGDEEVVTEWEWILTREQGQSTEKVLEVGKQRREENARRAARRKLNKEYWEEESDDE